MLKLERVWEELKLEREEMAKMAQIDALPNPGVNPLEGSPKCSCGKLGLERRSRLPAL